MRTGNVLAIVALLAVTPVTSAAVYAQAQQPPTDLRPFRGIFGAPAPVDSPQSLDLTASIFAAYADNVVEEPTDRREESPWLQRSGLYQGATAGLNYSFSLGGERAEFGGQAGAQLSYFRQNERSDLRPAGQVDLRLRAALTRSLAFTARQSIGYSSNYNGGVSPRIMDDGARAFGLPDPALDLFELRALSVATMLSLSQRIGRYTGISAAYQFRSASFLDAEPEGSPFADYSSHAGTLGILYARPMTRYATLQLGYGIRATDGRSRDGEPDILHNVNAGVNYSRALSFSRKTYFRFGTGSAIAVDERVDTEDGERRAEARLTGNAELLHQIGRTWTARLAYSRGFRTRDGFDQLYFTDAVTAQVSGLVTRRLSLGANGTWTNSSIGSVSRNDRGRSASVQSQYALSSLFAVYASYTYYKYRLDETVPIDDRFARALDRQGVRVGLMASVPLIR